MIENDQEIVLDSTNNVFVGPNGYFKIVIDEFDGQSILAWHVEDANGNSTGNLAARAKGMHIDALININNGSVAHFVNRLQKNLFMEQEAVIKQQNAVIAELRQQLMIAP